MYVVNNEYKVKRNIVSRLNHNDIIFAFLAFVAR